MNNVWNARRAMRLGSVALVLAAATAPAATVNVTGVYVGGPGAGGPGTQDPGNPNSYNGTAGDDGYRAGGADQYVFTGVTASGGAGGTITASDADPAINYSAGTGGAGLALVNSTAPAPSATITSGTYLGGPGGVANGTVAGQLNGGYGGDGLVTLYASAVVNGGLFVGGNSGQAVGTGQLGSGFAGSGANANNGSTLTINGGSFAGANGAVVPGGGTGAAGSGLLGIGGDVSVYGGTFLAGTGDSPGFDIDLYIGNITLYGTGFAVDGVPITATTTLTGSGTITGTLENNTLPSSITYINRDFGGTFTLVVTPEPATLGLLAVAGLGLGMRRRR